MEFELGLICSMQNRKLICYQGSTVKSIFLLSKINIKLKKKSIFLLSKVATLFLRERKSRVNGQKYIHLHIQNEMLEKYQLSAVDYEFVVHL